MSEQRSTNKQAVSEGSQGARLLMDLLQCNAFLAFWSQSFHTIAKTEETVACGGRLPQPGIAQVRQSASDETPLSRGRGRAHIQQAP